MLPYDAGDGLMVNGLSLGKENLQMNMTYSEKDATIAQFKAVLPQIKRELAKNLNAEGLILIVNKCVEANRGLVISFHGEKTGQSVDIEYTLDELKAAKK